MKDAMHRTRPGSTMLMPTANAAGGYGVDPITGAPVTDKFRAQQLLNPSAEMQSAFASYQRGSMPMMPARGGGGGGGGGRMGPREDRQKIMRTGPRTTADFVGRTGGLSPQRGSTLDAAYGRGDMRPMGGMPPVPAASNPFETGAPAPSSFVPANGGTLPPEAGQVFDQQTGGWKAPTPMAKGGTMTPDKIYTFGEEGVELGVPTGDGNMHVIPHGATKKLLPMLANVTPRAQGGPVELRTPSARFAGMTGPSGTGFAMTQTPSQQAMPMTMQDAGLAMLPGDRMIADDGFAVDLPALAAGGNESMPMMPDVVSGPWASPAMPVDSRQIGPNVQNQFSRLMAEGAMPASPYDGLMVPDQRISASGRDRLLTAQGSMEAPQMVPFAEMQERMAVRGIEASNRSFDARQADVDRQLAARAARAPLGTPVLPPTTPGGLPMIPGMERNIERFLRTPQGAMFALEQGTEDARMRQRMEMTQPVPLGDTGDFVVPFTGQVIQRQGDSRQMTPEEAQRLGLVPLESKNGVITYGKPKAGGGTSRLTYIPEVPSAVAGQPGTPARVFDPATGEFWEAGQPRPSRPSAEVGGAQTEAPAAPYNPFQ
jgi:hypothetical protein